MRGLFITIEGVEGSGKSTMCAKIEEHLRRNGHKVVLTREPGGTPFSEQLRDILLNSDDKIDSTAELLTMYAARAQHVNMKIKPLLEDGTFVVCDRFSMSSHAYQGYGRGLDLDIINKLDDITLGDFRPDLTLLFDIDVKLGMERVVARGKRDRFEQEELEFFEKVRSGFLNYAKEHSNEVVTINSSCSIEELESQVLAAIDDLIAKKS